MNLDRGGAARKRRAACPAGLVTSEENRVARIRRAPSQSSFSAAMHGSQLRESLDLMRIEQ